MKASIVLLVHVHVAIYFSVVGRLYFVLLVGDGEATRICRYARAGWDDLYFVAGRSVIEFRAHVIRKYLLEFLGKGFEVAEEAD